MAIRYAVQNGNWSNPVTWDGGTLPAAGDDVYADGYTITVDQDINVGSLHTDLRTGGTAGGTFNVSVASGQTRTITCTGPEPNVVAGPSSCIAISSPPAAATVVTNCSPRGGTSSGVYGINKNSLCVYQHAGNCYTGTVLNTPGIFIGNGSNNAINGNAYGTTGSSGSGIRGAITVEGGGTTAQVYGDAYGGQSFGVIALSGANCTLNGNVYTNGDQPGAYLYENARLTVNGNIYGHAINSGVAGCWIYAVDCLLILNGDAIAQAGPAINGGTGGRVVVNGNLVPTNTSYAVVNARLELRGTSFILASGRPGFGALYAFGISSTGNPAIKAKYYDAENNVVGAEDTLATSTTYGNLYPSESDVRYGISFGPADQWTGTAHIPAPGSVAYGVPVDHTTGTAILTTQAAANAIWDELRSAHTTPGTFGAVSEWAGGSGGGGLTAADVWSFATRTLTSAAGITSDGQAIDQTKIANLDAAVSTRLASASYISPDNTSIAAIKAQTDKLQFDANNRVMADAEAISGSAAAADALEANIANLDVAVSTRLAATAYTPPPSAADIWSHATRTLTAFAFQVTVGTNNDKSGYSLTAAYDRAKTALATAEYTSPDNASIAAIKAQTDKLQFDANNRVLSDATATVDAGAIADAVWDELRSEHTTTGTYGAVTEWAGGGSGGGITAADVWAYATRTLTSPANITSDGQAIDQSKLANLDVAVSSRAATSDARFDYLDANISSRLAAASYVSPDNAGIAAIKSQTDKLQFDANNRVLSDAMAAVDVGAVAGAVWDEPRSQHIIAGTFGAVGEWASASAGTGARTIVVTVNDGAGPLESATVRATKGAETYTVKTNVVGQATFYLDDGTWTFVATLAGYDGASAIHIVDAAQSPLTISLPPLTMMPIPPGTVRGYAIILDEYGNPEPGVTCSAQLVYAPSGSGIVGDIAAQIRVSDVNGVVQFTGLLPGGTYKFSRGEQFILVVVPTDATDPWQIPNFGGAP